MKLRSMLSALVALSAVAAYAGEDATPFTAKLQLVSPQGNLRQLTGSAIGYGLELAWDFNQGNYLSFQAHADHFVVRGKKTGGLEKFDAKGTFIGVDARYQTAFGTVFSGPVIVTWDIYGEPTAAGGTGALGESGWKLGWRVGYDYPVNKTWNVGISYTVAEYKSTQGAVANRVSPLNPSFVKVGVGYQF